MIRINLLPHREEKRKAKRQQFFVLTALVAVLAGLIVFLGYSIISGYITTQDERNDFLKKEIAVLDKQLEEIKRLKEQTAALLSRKQIIESLQSDRAEAVQLLNEMVKQMPEGVYLKSLKQEDRRITMTGYTQSNARVSTLMRNL
ncbi:MAG: type pilus assembly protein PilN, partial [Pseudomonadota bacterium]|nr:type pilus assembly protein PilN [Pseudomonadota bacterium]